MDQRMDPLDPGPLLCHVCRAQPATVRCRRCGRIVCAHCNRAAGCAGCCRAPRSGPLGSGDGQSDAGTATPSPSANSSAHDQLPTEPADAAPAAVAAAGLSRLCKAYRATTLAVLAVALLLPWCVDPFESISGIEWWWDALRSLSWKIRGTLRVPANAGRLAVDVSYAIIVPLAVCLLARAFTRVPTLSGPSVRARCLWGAWSGLVACGIFALCAWKWSAKVGPGLWVLCFLSLWALVDGYAAPRSLPKDEGAQAMLSPVLSSVCAIWPWLCSRSPATCRHLWAMLLRSTWAKRIAVGVLGVVLVCLWRGSTARPPVRPALHVIWQRSIGSYSVGVMVNDTGTPIYNVRVSLSVLGSDSVSGFMVNAGARELPAVWFPPEYRRSYPPWPPDLRDAQGNVGFWGADRFGRLPIETALPPGGARAFCFVKGPIAVPSGISVSVDGKIRGYSESVVHRRSLIEGYEAFEGTDAITREDMAGMIASTSRWLAANGIP